MDRTEQTGIEREDPNQALHRTRLSRVGEFMRNCISRRFLLRWILPCALVIFALGVWYWVRKPQTAEDIVAVAVRDVNREVSWGLRLHGAVWELLPKMAKDVLPAPENIGWVRRAAFEELQRLGPQSDLAVRTLLKVLENPRRSRDEHQLAIRALGRIGPFAKEAVEPLLKIIAATTNTFLDPFELGNTCFSALSSIAPTDARVLNAVFEEIQRTNAYPATIVLDPNADRYDEKVQARLLSPIRTTDPMLKTSLIRVAGKIQPNSSRTASILVEWLRGNDSQARDAVVRLMIEHPVRKMEIARELSHLLAELQADFPQAPSRFSGLIARSGQMERAWLNRIRFANWADPRCSTITALGKMGQVASESVSLLQAHLSHPEVTVRSTTAIALFRITGDSSHAEKLYGELLGDEEVEVRKLAVLDLGQISAECPASVPLLIRALKDREFKVRQHAIIGLGAAGTNAVAALPHLMSMMNDRSRAIQYDATNAIVKIRGGSAAE